jgi:hypothetical protein
MVIKLKQTLAIGPHDDMCKIPLSKLQKEAIISVLDDSNESIGENVGDIENNDLDIS